MQRKNKTVEGLRQVVVDAERPLRLREVLDRAAELGFIPDDHVGRGYLIDLARKGLIRETKMSHKLGSGYEIAAWEGPA